MSIDWSKILDWKLLRGSHGFPGPDGGTCINEAAIVAAGFEYRKVDSAEDCPPCFSPPISAFLIHLNDAMDDGDRNRFLMPYVTRLVGTASNPEVELERAEIAAHAALTKFAPIGLRVLGNLTAADRLENIPRPRSLVGWNCAEHIARSACPQREDDNPAEWAAFAAQGVGGFHCDQSPGNLMYACASAADCISRAVSISAYFYYRWRARVEEGAGTPSSSIPDVPTPASIWASAMETLDAMLAVGPQASPIEQGLVVERMNKARRNAVMEAEG